MGRGRGRERGQKSKARLLLTGGLVLLVATGAIAAAMRSTPEHTDRFIENDAGQALVQHGFSTAGSAKSTPDGLPVFTEQELVRESEDMGTNFVRFLISWRAVEPRPGVYDQAYLDAVEERVGWYEERGYHVMLDMHQDLWGRYITPGLDRGNGAPEWATFMDGLPVQEHDMWELIYLEPGVIRAFDNFWNTSGAHPELTQHYVDAWRAVAERFADNQTVVAYDLMNEPYGGTLQGVAFESGPLTDLYQRAIDAIREVDNDTWVCLEPQAFGFNWGLPSALGVVDDARAGDPRVAFCPHLYPLPMDLGDGFVGSSKPLIEGTIDQWAGNVLRTAARLGQGAGPVPVILGEFGLDTNAAGAEQYVKLVYQTADARGFGVAYWSRDNGTWGPYEQDGSERNLVAWLDRPYPRAVAGLESWSTDGESLVFTVSRQGSAQIYLPNSLRAATPKVAGAKISGWDAATGMLHLQTSGPGEVRVTVG